VEHILPAYNDPLFSILLIITTGLIIALATYGWGIYKQQKEAGNLLKFLDQFDSAECALDTANMPFEMHMLKPLSLLAKAFESAGEYHKAISIYLYLIKNGENEATKTELMERLGSTYLHAGFLERARSIYVEILRKKPRSRRVLYELEVVYELMQQFDKAKETIEPLRILGEDTCTLEHFILFSELIYRAHFSIEERVSALQKLLREDPSLYRLVIAALLQLDTQSAWKNIDPSRLKEILDILWLLPSSQLDLDIISADTKLSTLYYAKGYLQRPIAQSGIFALDMIARAKENGCEEADLQFSYLCKKCKQSFPVSFKRCPGCMAINSVEVEEQIAKASTQTDYSLL
jgi:lipopolysaccharide biosynthesis regulator YciM